MGCYDRLVVPKFSGEDIADTVKRERLLTMEIEFNSECNFNCIYCYVEHKTAPGDELSPEEFRDVISQARDMGVRTMVVLGGEPMLYPYLMEMIRYMRGLDLEVELFTNGAHMTESMARALFEHEVTVVLKMNTFQEELQDMLAGRPGAYKQIQASLANLKGAGYPGPERRLGISTIICNQNYDELAKLWKWIREQEITPYFEMITPQGGAKVEKSLYIKPSRMQELFQQLSVIDKAYGYDWDPKPPLVGMGCLRHQYSCVLSPNGDICPCVGVNIPVGNVREKTLKEIIKGSEVIKNLRNYKKNIKGPCRECEELDECYGCRGAAYQLTGDYLASDPLCWKNRDRLDGIRDLPVKAEELIPHRSPMRLVDRLLEFKEHTTVEVQVTEEMIFLGKDGHIDDVAYLEMIGQAAAVHDGFKNMGNGATTKGFLIGAKNLKVYGTASVGETLMVSVRKIAEYGEMAAVQGEIYKNATMLASGEIKVWHRSGNGV